MTATTKAILVTPTLGPGNSGTLPQALVDYCEALRSATPTSAVRTDQRGTDLGQLNLAANMKALQVDAEDFGVSVDWTPAMFHASGPDGDWDPDANVRGIIYVATVGETEYYISVRLET